MSQEAKLNGAINPLTVQQPHQVINTANRLCVQREQDIAGSSPA
jgi:hypothetical protein